MDRDTRAVAHCVLCRHVMSTINLTHEMAEIKEQLARSAAIRADTWQREKEAEEETARSHLRLNNLEIALRNVQVKAQKSTLAVQA
jgi:cell division protein ZapA (FtsZ GTPase activity inhibitor)